MKEDFSGRRVTVMGLGTFGGGVAATRFLAEQGAEVTVTDLRTRAQLADSVALLGDLTSVRFQLGGHDEADFTNSDLIVASPAVKPENRFLALARQAGVPITSELRLFWRRCAARIIGVTGSNGKSTTATLIHDMLKADGRCVWLGGNIGRSLLPEVNQIRCDHWVVLELSSFQLFDLNTERLSPHVAVVTNITPNHLDWHGSFEDYVDAKQSIVRWQQPGDIAVRFPDSREAAWTTKASSWWFGWGDDERTVAFMTNDRSAVVTRQNGTHIPFSNCSGLPYSHARFNAVTATATALSLGVQPGVIRRALESFSGLPHRMQVVCLWRGRRFFNDSASTTPESTCAAVAGFPDTGLLLICGGSEKGSDLAPLVGSVCTFARRAYIIGDVASEFAERTRRFQTGRRRDGHACRLETVIVCENLAAACSKAVEHSKPGEVILFSPGFSSGTMFRNFADRGDAFCSLVRALS